MLYTPHTAGAVLLILCGAVYFLPSIIGWRRRVAHGGLLFFGNFLFGVSIGGWFVALVYALCGQTRMDMPMRPICYARAEPPPLRR